MQTKLETLKLRSHSKIIIAACYINAEILRRSIHFLLQIHFVLCKCFFFDARKVQRVCWITFKYFSDIVNRINNYFLFETDYKKQNNSPKIKNEHLLFKKPEKFHCFSSVLFKNEIWIVVKRTIKAQKQLLKTKQEEKKVQLLSKKEKIKPGLIPGHQFISLKKTKDKKKPFKSYMRGIKCEQ
ncbi:hypothetical protein RFI_15704 [Reticulomyxa filosa]|uniref:Uncharacterized protein n=1 Tax=Reticulomyxa filosa TaxID=46433 RepID=X6N6E7_RETFI|nr:hypothetical protein RFI_15704 [Reticulomyxa filosa]|eukprot:ETO21498.1 hypothetical protein RFI_15704 [Reticulomyxa filosa]